MARRKGRSRRSLNSRPKGKGKHGGKWKHGFIPRNAVARKLKLPSGVTSIFQEQDIRT